MIIINVRTQVRPDKRDEFLAAIEQETPISRDFPGCISYVWSEQLGAANQFALYEEWETRQSFDAYRNSAHFQYLMPTFTAFFSDSPQSSYYEGALLENA